MTGILTLVIYSATLIECITIKVNVQAFDYDIDVYQDTIGDLMNKHNKDAPAHQIEVLLRMGVELNERQTLYQLKLLEDDVIVGMKRPSFGRSNKCDIRTLGNGKCDEASNNGECLWDGGDCCRSTCENSDHKCGIGGFDCKDPQGLLAAEHPDLFLEDREESNQNENIYHNDAQENKPKERSFIFSGDREDSNRNKNNHRTDGANKFQDTRTEEHRLLDGRETVYVLARGEKTVTHIVDFSTTTITNLIGLTNQQVDNDHTVDTLHRGGTQLHGDKTLLENKVAHRDYLTGLTTSVFGTLRGTEDVKEN